MASSSEMTQIDPGDKASLEPRLIGDIHLSLQSPKIHHDLPSSPKASLSESLIDFEDVELPTIEQHPPQKEQKDSKPRTVVVKTTKPLGKDASEVPPLHKVKMKVSDLVNDTDDLKREIKALNRENRDQSIELRDVKKQNAQLRETCRMRNENADTHRDQIHHERNKFYEHVEGLEDHIAYLKQELIRRKTLVESLTLQTREANDEKLAHEVTARKLQKQNRDLHENLTECKDDLLRLQPPSQIPDSELAEQYSSLTQHISRWVDDETEDSQGMETCFESLSKADDLPEPLKPYLTDEHIRLGKKCPNAQPFIIRFVVHRYLENCIFGNDVYLFGLDSRSIELFAGIERGMHELEPPRDEITIRRWRSETLQGLSHMPEFLSQQSHQALSVSQSLYKTLLPLLPPSQTRDEGWKALHEQVTLPAVKLATSMRRSIVDYRIWSRPSTKDTGTGKDDRPGSREREREREKAHIPVCYSAIQRASMVDMATNKVIRPDSVLKVAEDGRIGEEMLIVQPSLLKAPAKEGGNGGGGGNVTLVKPTVLVKLDEPMGKRSRGIKALGEWTGSWFGSAGAGSADGGGNT